MSAYFLAEWREWKVFQGRRTMSAALIVAFLAACSSWLHPILSAWAFTALNLLLGWSRGNRYANGLPSRNLADACPLPASGFALATSGVAVSVWAAHLLCVAPALGLMTREWNIGALALLSAILSWLGSYLLAFACGLLASVIQGKRDRLVAFAFFAIWLSGTGFVRPLGFLNPFIQSWTSLRLSPTAALPGAGIDVVIAGVAIASASALFVRKRRLEYGF